MRPSQASDPGIEDTLLPELAVATLATALAVATTAIAERLLGFDDPSLVFITAVMFVAVRTRMSVAVYCAVLCFLAYNFFFIQPRYTLYISARQGVLTVAMFLVAALVCGRLANRLRAQVLLLRAAHAQTAALQELGRKLMAAASETDAVQATTLALRDVLDAEVLLLIVDEDSGRLPAPMDAAGAPRFDPSLQAAIDRCWSSLSAGKESPADPETTLSWHCLPIALRQRPLGVACLRFPTPLPQLPAELAQLAEAMLRDLAQALARARLVRQLEATRVQAESERLRAALLSSVSHDLRSPLSTIIGSAESLSLYRDRLSLEDQVALAQDILGEGRRLDRYIQNLLDMTRVGQGALALEREWIGLDEIGGALLARLRDAHPRLTVRLELPEPPPLLFVHPALFEQALFNVLDNAAKFSPPGEAVVVHAERFDGTLRIDVIDRGPGIPEAERGQVFDRFYSGERGDRGPPGTGLGLTICQAIVAAHGGEVAALAGKDGRGAILRIRLPLRDPPDTQGDESP
jgi:two-component system sensor histidine kinase KdpD